MHSHSRVPSERTHHVAQLGWFLLCCVMFLSSSDAFAAPKTFRIAVMARQSKTVGSKQVRWFAQTFRKALRTYRRIQVPKNQSVQKILIARVVSKKKQSQIPVLKKYLAKAKALYATAIPMKKRCQYVLRALNLANQKAEEVKTLLTEPNVMRDLYLYYALAYFGVSNKQKTRDYTVRLAQFAPKLRLTGNSFPAGFVQYFNSIVRWVQGQPKLTMKLDTIPRGAVVYHNYRRVGVTPYTLSGLVPGKHSIRLIKPGYAVWERVANLSLKKLGSRRVIRAKLPLKRDPNALYLGNNPIFERDAVHSDDILDLLDKITQRVQVNYLYIIEPHRNSKGFMLKIAIYQKGSRKLVHGRLPLGSNSGRFRSSIKSFAGKINKLLSRVR